MGGNMKVGLIALILFSLFIITTKAMEEAQFTIEELEKLIAKGQWYEAIRRTTEIPAGQRPKNWDIIVEKAAIGYIRDIASRDRSEADDAADDLIKAHPNLKRSRTFRETRNLNALAGFDACYDQKDSTPECTKRIIA